jgi:hypothetical protein
MDTLKQEILEAKTIQNNLRSGLLTTRDVTLSSSAQLETL